MHDDHKQIADDACTRVEGWSEWGNAFGKQAMSILVVFCGELDQNLPGRGVAWDLHLRKIYRMLLVGFIDDLELCTEKAIHFRDELKRGIQSDWLGRVDSRIRPQDFGRRNGARSCQEDSVQLAKSLRAHIYRHEHTCNVEDPV